jgi:hypothetical protein
LLQKSDSASERGAASDAGKAAALNQLKERLKDEDVLLASDSLAPSSRAWRLPSATQGKRTFIDGPFAESKELVAGFSLLSLPSKEAALAWAERYAAVLGDNEVDVREVLEPTA